MPTKKSKKPTTKVNKAKTASKPAKKVSNLSKSIAKIGRKKVLALSGLITLLIFAFMMSLSGISNIIASSTNEAVLGSSTPDTPKNLTILKTYYDYGPLNAATLSWKTGPLNDGADEHEITDRQENCTFPIVTTTTVQTDEGSIGNYYRKKSLFSITHQTTVWGFKVRKECSNIRPSFTVRVRAVKIKNGVKTYSGSAEVRGLR